VNVSSLASAAPVLLALISACQSAGESPAANGGSANGGSLSGGASAGGTSGAASSGAAGAPSSGGAATSGGAMSGGSSSGGSLSGGATSAGGANGGSLSGGAAGASAGAANGGAVGGGGASSGCATQSELLFCEDFEKLAPGPLPSGGVWSTSYIGPDAPGIAVDDTTPARSGTHSVVVRAPITNFQSFLNYHDAAVLPRAAKEFYLRIYVRLGRDMASGHNAYLILDRMAQPGAGAAVRLGEQAAMLSLTVGGDSHGTLSNSRFSQDQVLGPHFVKATWSCLEGYFNSAKPEIDFWLDGAEIGDFHHSDWPADDYDTIRFGLEKYAGPELEIWFDDIALGAARVGCR
jgi:hypothetical protein